MTPLESFLSDVPKIHSWDGGKTWHSGGLSSAELGWIIETIASRFGPSALVAETGAGCSTIAFLLSQAARVHSVSLEPETIDRIRAQCARLGISDTALEVYLGRSELLLPTLCADLRSRAKLLDFALVDGGHGWPTVFVDFCYLHSALKRNGILMIDDVHVHSVKELARFLSADPRFRLVKAFAKTIAFEKLSDLEFLPDFGGQPYIVLRMQRDREAGTTFDIGL